MDFKSFKERLTIKEISNRLKQTILRFPVCTFFLAIFTFFWAMLILDVKINENGIIGISYFLIIGILLDLIFSLWSEGKDVKQQRFIAECITMLLWGAYCFWFCSIDSSNFKSPAFGIGNAVWIFSLILIIPFVPFIGSKNDTLTWHFAMSLLFDLIISAATAGITIAGILGLFFGIESLFGLNFTGSVPENIPLLICDFGLFLFGILVLALIPNKERQVNTGTARPILKNITQWLLLPLLYCYIAVLYVYAISILIKWELPKGTLSWLVSVVVIGYIICYTILHPYFKDIKKSYYDFLTKWLPIIILPLLVLMTVGTGKRISDYGLTAPRLYLLTMLIWFYAVCIVVAISKEKRFNWIYLSLALILLLTSAHPLNYYFISKKIISHNVQKTIDKYQLETPFEWNNVKNSLPDEEFTHLYDKISYLRETYGWDIIEQWVSDIPYNYKPVESDRMIWDINYQKYRYYQFVVPQGYNSFTEISYRVFDCAENEIKDGILPVECNGNTLLFDTATISQANNQYDLIIKTSDNDNLFIPKEISISNNSKSGIIGSYSGYLFSKEPTASK